jgi:hypothetical protein
MDTSTYRFTKTRELLRMVYSLQLDSETIETLADKVSEACAEAHARGYDAAADFEKWLHSR